MRHASGAERDEVPAGGLAFKDHKVVVKPVAEVFLNDKLSDHTLTKVKSCRCFTLCDKLTAVNNVFVVRCSAVSRTALDFPLQRFYWNRRKRSSFGRL